MNKLFKLSFLVALLVFSVNESNAIVRRIVGGALGTVAFATNTALAIPGAVLGGGYYGNGYGNGCCGNGYGYRGYRRGPWLR